MLASFFTGVIVSLYAVACMFFLKFWRKSRDRLFLAFAIAFSIEGLNRIRPMFLDQPGEGSAAIYLVRLLAFAFILAAIVDRNSGLLTRRRPGKAARVDRPD